LQGNLEAVKQAYIRFVDILSAIKHMILGCNRSDSISTQLICASKATSKWIDDLDEGAPTPLIIKLPKKMRAAQEVRMLSFFVDKISLFITKIYSKIIRKQSRLSPKLR